MALPLAPSLKEEEDNLRIRIRGKGLLQELRTNQSVRLVAKLIGLRHVGGLLEHA